MDICKVPTKDLIHELVQREGIKKIGIGLYQSYDLVPKYGASTLGNDTAVCLVITDLNGLLNIPDTPSTLTQES